MFIYIIIVMLALYVLLYIYVKYIYNTIIDLSTINHVKYKNKKVCLLLSGQIRDNYYKTLMSQKIFIIDPLKADVFCVFSDDIDLIKKKHVESILGPTNIQWIKDNKNIHNNKFTSLNTNLMFQKIYETNLLKNHNYVSYDICIRSRPDLYIKQVIPNIYIDNIAQNTVYTPYFSKLDIINHVFYLGITDQFWICDSKTMNKICDIYINIMDNRSKCKLPELILKQHIDHNNIKIKYISNYAYIIDRLGNTNNNTIKNTLSMIADRNMIQNFVQCVRP